MSAPTCSSLLAALALLAACSAPPSRATSPTAPPPPRATTPAPVEAPAAPSASAPPAEAPPVSAQPPEPSFDVSSDGREWQRELDVPAGSIGVGKQRVAVTSMADEDRVRSVWLREGDRWRDLELPERLRAGEGERDDLRVWFGRDDRPRVMGTRVSAEGASRLVYLRWKGNWRDKPGEIGRLDARPEGVLFGILGHDDPEVVCKLSDVCIIKRLTGWTMIPPPPEPLRVELEGKGAVGVGATSAWRLGADGWLALAPSVPWTTPPAGLWASGTGEVWVAEPGRDRLHRWDGTGWSEHPSPHRGPRALWGSGPDDVYLAAEGGAGHWDGSAWSRLKAPEGSFADVRGGYQGEVWLAGESGVWRGAAVE